MVESLAIDRNFRAYALALLRHHYLLSESSKNDLQIDVVEDRMSALWEKLNETQRDELRGVSSDLNWLRRGSVPPPQARRADDVTQAELDELNSLVDLTHCRLPEVSLSKNIGPVFRLLNLLRVCSPRLSNGFMAISRAWCYFGLGLREVSEPFLKAAVDLTADRSDASRAAFVTLIHVSPSGAFQKATEVVVSPERYPPVVVAFAIQFFVEFLGGDSPAISRQDLAEKMRRASERLDDEPSPHEDRVLFYSLAGAQLLSFGFVEDSIGFLERGLKMESENAELVGWLGEAVYNKDRERAVELFKRSIASGTRLIRPYLHLANHFLVERDFERAKAYAAHAAEMARDDFSLAVALEIMAISLSEHGSPDNIVLGLLRRAAKLAPGNKRIAHNLSSFEKILLGKTSPAMWDTREPREVLESRERWRADERGLVFA